MAQYKKIWQMFIQQTFYENGLYFKHKMSQQKWINTKISSSIMQTQQTTEKIKMHLYR